MFMKVGAMTVLVTVVFSEPNSLLGTERLHKYVLNFFFFPKNELMATL